MFQLWNLITIGTRISLATIIHNELIASDLSDECTQFFRFTQLCEANFFNDNPPGFLSDLLCNIGFCLPTQYQQQTTLVLLYQLPLSQPVSLLYSHNQISCTKWL